MPEDKDNQSFSQRYGYTPVKTKIQLESMDNELRTGLWNVLIRIYFYERSFKYNKLSQDVHLRILYKKIWEYFLNWNLQSLERTHSSNIKTLLKEFKSFKWFKVYDLIQFIANQGWESEKLIAECNIVLKRELSAYRLVGSNFVRITSEIEIKTIETALQTPYGSVNQHLETALSLLSDRVNPDFRNSMKESISAIEAISRIIEGKPKNTLGKLLNYLEEDKGLHPLLNKGFTALYHYTSDAEGIRHALTEDSTVGYEDAIYLLGTCSAFVNYLIAKYGE